MSQSIEQQGRSSRGTLLIFQTQPLTTLRQGGTFTVIVRVVFGYPWSHLDTEMRACSVNISLAGERGTGSRAGLLGSFDLFLAALPQSLFSTSSAHSK